MTAREIVEVASWELRKAGLQPAFVAAPADAAFVLTRAAILAALPGIVERLVGAVEQQRDGIDASRDRGSVLRNAQRDHTYGALKVAENSIRAEAERLAQELREIAP